MAAESFPTISIGGETGLEPRTWLLRDLSEWKDARSLAENQRRKPSVSFAQRLNSVDVPTAAVSTIPKTSHARGTEFGKFAVKCEALCVGNLGGVISDVHHGEGLVDREGLGFPLVFFHLDKYMNFSIGPECFNTSSQITIDGRDAATCISHIMHDIQYIIKCALVGTHN